ncbi:hypothetical protein CPB83DRAFT_563747 [Crepidotus variabilis]|uniref:Uncharacterized protein n=1 Tax=Crepidotus variabilis TaxID=179855 RepID=A0A9P6JLF3_9AGAR|nr:hypothetical protein CPB83DRAFT_563747 [Crepidotus variabilis]
MRLKVLVVVTILHEMMHLLIDVTFGCLTPPGRHYYDWRSNSGWALENLLLGGNLQVCWNEEESGEMDRIVSLALVRNGDDFVFGLTTAGLFLASLESADIRPVVIGNLIHSQPDDLRRYRQEPGQIVKPPPPPRFHSDGLIRSRDRFFRYPGDLEAWG